MNKVAFITGAGGFIGNETAITLAKSGIAIAVCDINESAIKETVSRIEALGGKAFGRVLDVSDPQDVNAAVAGMSTVYFRKLFTGIIGISPIAYARKLRIEKAMEMLKTDYGTLSDLSQSLGYASLYDFSRDFKKHTGVSPSRYERKHED